MTFFHFVNCVLLAYAPVVITFKFSGLSEYSTVWKCLQAAMAYFVTQFAKMMVLATFFPTEEGASEFDLLMAAMSSCADIFDVFGMHLAMNHLLTGRGEMRFIAAGVGWAGAHSVASYFVTFISGARATAFSWGYIQLALAANIDLFFFVSMATLVWLFNRNDLANTSKKIVIGLLAFCVFHTFIYQLFTIYGGLRSWTLVLAKALCTAALSAMTLISYSGLGSQKNHH